MRMILPQLCSYKRFLVSFYLVQSAVDGDLLDQLCSSEEIWTDIQFPDLPVPEGRKREREGGGYI